MREIVYVGKRNESRGGQAVYVQSEENDVIGRKFLDPAASQRLHNHSPDGFEWGYGGSGPAQLALAILLDAGLRHYPVDVDRRVDAIAGAMRLYQEFKRLHVARFEFEGFRLRLADVEEFVFARGGWTGNPAGA